MNEKDDWHQIKQRCEKLLKYIDAKLTQAFNCYIVTDRVFLSDVPGIDILNFSMQTPDQVRTTNEYWEVQRKKIKEFEQWQRNWLQERIKEHENQNGAQSSQIETSEEFEDEEDDDYDYEDESEKEKNLIGRGYDEDFECIREIDIKNRYSFQRIRGFYSKLHEYIDCLLLDAGHLGRLNYMDSKTATWPDLKEKKQDALLDARRIGLNELEEYERVLNEKLMLMIGYWSAKDFEHRQFHYERLERARKTKIETRQKAKREAERLFIQLSTSTDKSILKNMSETSMLNIIKERLDPYLKENGLYHPEHGIAINTVRKMLREGHSEGKFPYPWL